MLETFVLQIWFLPQDHKMIQYIFTVLNEWLSQEWLTSLMFGICFCERKKEILNIWALFRKVTAAKWWGSPAPSNNGLPSSNVYIESLIVQQKCIQLISYSKTSDLISSAKSYEFVLYSLIKIIWGMHPWGDFKNDWIA